MLFLSELFNHSSLGKHTIGLHLKPPNFSNFTDLADKDTPLMTPATPFVDHVETHETRGRLYIQLAPAIWSRSSTSQIISRIDTFSIGGGIL